MSYDSAPTDAIVPPPRPLHPLRICGILSTAFCYGCVVTTLFLLVLPIECRRIELLTRGNLSKSILLGIFAAIAGASQLVCPLIGMLSDRYRPRTRGKGRRQKRTDNNEDAENKAHNRWVRGRRMPYLLCGSVLVEIGLIGMNTTSMTSCYSIYTIFFALAMVGINITYCVMIALIPDLIPHEQTGMANGSLALLLVSGSLFGFGFFEVVLDISVRANYLVYMLVMASTCIIAFFSANGLSGKKEDEEDMVSKQTVDSATLSSENESIDANWLSTLPGLLSLGIIPTLHNMIYRPLSTMTWAEIRHAYWVDPKEHHDFFVVTLSRLFYYLGLSAQCFFLYFVHDIIHERENPEAAASGLAMITTAAGAVTCYPVGIISDRFFGGRRKPFVYGACAILALSNIALLWCTTIRQMACVCATLGSANGVYLTMDTSLAVDTLDVLSELEEEVAAEKGDNAKDEEVTGEDSLLFSRSTEMAAEAVISKGKKHDGAAQLLGIWGVAGFVGSALGPLVGGPLLFYFGRSVQRTFTAAAAAAAAEEEEEQDEDGGYAW
eukprot:CAMPEP_0181043974 /NCGR_PEP_ID=MMETSP1070-20121207/13007_1 /TAXON_ID=265543 /ORGANISM="Minutocellus polymorphus, Strain NH13" /LENGTH=550 /DNA_ID=CAMNT_0023122365 /DNA_START=1 /DNA_END=1650 /DNA_ORIENTATION=-